MVDRRPTLATMALQTSPEHPAAVRTIARSLVEYVARLGPVWIEGQVAQLSRRPGAARVFVTLRDTEADGDHPRVRRCFEKLERRRRAIGPGPR